MLGFDFTNRRRAALPGMSRLVTSKLPTIKRRKVLNAARELKMQKSGYNPSNSTCECVKCHHHKTEAQDTFENVATVIGIYKLAHHWVRVVKSDPHATPEQIMEREQDLEDAEGMLGELIDGIEKLSPASRQQLTILFDEMKILAVERGLAVGRRSSYYEGYEDEDSPVSDPPSPEGMGASGFRGPFYHEDDDEPVSDPPSPQGGPLSVGIMICV